MTGIEQLDPYTVRITTDAPNPTLLANLSYIWIIPREAREKMGAEAFGQQPIGTGPYRFVEFIRGDRLVLDANPSYWRGQVTPKRLTLRTITDPATRVAELKTGGSRAPIFMYLFTWSGDALGGQLKASHGLEVPFTMNNPDIAAALCESRWSAQKRAGPETYRCG